MDHITEVRTVYVQKIIITNVLQSHILFDVQRDWELAQLERAPPDEANMIKEHIGEILQLRLKQPHASE